MAKGKIAGNAKILLTLDDRVQAGLRKLQSRFAAMSKPIMSLGTKAAAIGSSLSGALFGAAALFSKTGSEIADMSARTGIGAESLSELRYAAKQTGVEMNSLEMAARKMQKDGLDPNDFDRFAAEIAAIQDPVRQAQAAMELWGTRSGTALLPLIRDLPRLRDEARRLGLVMSTEDATAADRLGDSMDTAWAQISKLVETIGSAVAGPLSDFLEWSQSVLTAGIAWAQQNKGLVRLFAGIAGGALVAASAFFAVGGALALGGIAAGGLASAVGVIGTILGAIVSPAGAVVAAIGGLAYYFATATETGKTLVSNLATWFGELAGIAKTTFGGIVAAVGGGDLAAAGRVGMAGLNLAWQKGTHGLETLWIKLSDSVLEVMTRLVFKVQELWTEMSAGIRTLWAGLVTESKSVGERVGHWLTRSDNAELAAEQDAASDNALRNIQREGANDKARIEQERVAALQNISANRVTAAQDRDRRLASSLSAAEADLAAAMQEFSQASKAANEAGAKGLSAGASADLDAAQLALAGIGSVAAFRPQQAAMLDASLAAQQFGGGRDDELQTLREIAKNTKPKKFEFSGLPVS